ncbi:hypothetical protein [Mesorhizobium sp.]|uniref:hypothetical protein n=1 Tax=Mesorhizobium sp. TaxID=1871066 RepID=UPI000FE6E043|nr:hypothetical protein [Mesorhizobium sp.]RWE78800.1 MAG: hypothetical protein EOS42_04245 [Mesorhizobium sp.]
MTLIYSDGTISVTNGDAVVLGTGTAWAVSGIAGGLLSCNGLSVPIASVTDDSTLVLAYPWPGDSGAGQIYAIQRENSVAANIVDVYDKLSQVLRQLALAGIHPSAVGTIAERNALTLGVSDKDFIFLYLEIGFDLAFYRWTGTAWQGPFAVKGADGPAGQSAPGASGYRFRYSTATTAADPGSGKLRFNNATLSAATALYLSETTNQSQGIAAYVAAWFGSGSTIKGTLRLIKELDPSVFAIFNITGSLTDNGTWDTVTVAHLASAGALVDNDLVRIEFVRTGDVGNTGPAAAPTFTYSTTTADADPGSGVFRFDNATLASVTKAFVDNLNAGGSDSSAWLDSFDDATSVVKGMLILQCTTTVGVGGAFYVTGTVVNGTGYRKLSLTPIATWGVWANGQTFSWIFTRTGDKGDPTGYRQTFSTTTTDADPGNGTIRANNATFASVTQLFADNLDAGGASITAFLDGLDDSTTTTNRGTLRLSNVADPTIYQEYIVTGAVVDGTGYRKIPVSPVASAGALTNGMPLVLTFARTGNAGAGTGDVVGPAASTAGRIATFGDGTGKLIGDSGILASALAPKDAPTFTTSVTITGTLTVSGTATFNGNMTFGSRVATNGYDVTQHLALYSTTYGFSVSSSTLNHVSQANHNWWAGTVSTMTLDATGHLSIATPTASGHAATKGYVDGLTGIGTTTARGTLEIATAAEFQAASASLALSPDQVWSAAAVSPLTEAATIAVNMAAGFDFGGAANGVLALTADRALGAPSNVKSGQKGVLWFGASGATRNLTLNAAWALCTGVEAGPYAILTTGILGVAYAVRGTTVYVTGILRVG